MALVYFTSSYHNTQVSLSTDGFAPVILERAGDFQSVRATANAPIPSDELYAKDQKACGL